MIDDESAESDPRPRALGGMPFVWAFRVSLVAVAVALLVLLISWPSASAGRRAEAVLAVGPAPRLERPLSGPLLEKMVTKYSTFAAADSTLATAASVLGLTLDELRSATDVAVVAGTGNITISTTLQDGQRALAAVDRIAGLTLERSTRDPFIRVTLLSAKIQAGSGGRLREILVGVALALAAGVASGAVSMRIASIVYRAGLPQ